ncbi:MULTISPECIES: hypothetical protein [unclassified Gluconobacter]|uniref:hypothetical protein n=1 Tax=unclassified Gluconobacter TaxID=2644261 RepID=UPI00175BF598|nr:MULTISPECIES: hypothetical protein [unclassified Gluconobacter]GFE95442.1 hypothetical protein DmGdi_05150 [Gluconobacter sp. Gdi]
MLNFLLIVLCLVTWAGVYVFHFREKITEWWDNRFVKDKPPEAQDEPAPELQLPIRYDAVPPETEKKDA